MNVSFFIHPVLSWWQIHVAYRSSWKMSYTGFPITIGERSTLRPGWSHTWTYLLRLKCILVDLIECNIKQIGHRCNNNRHFKNHLTYLIMNMFLLALWSGHPINILIICFVLEHYGPYSRKRIDFSPGLNLIFVILINVKSKVSPGLVQD